MGFLHSDQKPLAQSPSKIKRCIPFVVTWLLGTIIGAVGAAMTISWIME
jgi:hypothetical protein